MDFLTYIHFVIHHSNMLFFINLSSIGLELASHGSKLLELGLIDYFYF